MMTMKFLLLKKYLTDLFSGIEDENDALDDEFEDEEFDSDYDDEFSDEFETFEEEDNIGGDF